MSITPVDKPPDGVEDSGRAANGRSWSVTSGLKRTFSLVAKCLTAVRERMEPTDPEHDRARETPARTPTTLDTDARACGSIDGFPDREHPLTYPGRNLSGINSPDVVSLETEDGLRLSIPENPDAQLTSDVWMTVEP